MSESEVGKDVWYYLTMIGTASIVGAVQALRGWRNGDPGNDEARKGGDVQDERYRKVYIESAELADLGTLRAIPGRLDSILNQLATNYTAMIDVKQIVEHNHAIMMIVERVVTQNNQILTAVHDIRDALSNAEKVRESVRLERVEDMLRRDRGNDRP